MIRYACVDPGSARVAIAIGDVVPGARPRLVTPPLTIEVGRRVPRAKPYTSWIRLPCEAHIDVCACVRRHRAVEHTHKREVTDDDEDAVYIAIYEHLQAHRVEVVIVEGVGSVYGVEDAREMAAIAYDLIRTAPIARAAKDAALALNLRREPSPTSQAWRAVVLKGIDRGEAKGAARGGHTVPAAILQTVLLREIDGWPETAGEDERDAGGMLAWVAMRARAAEQKARKARPDAPTGPRAPSMRKRLLELVEARRCVSVVDAAAALGVERRRVHRAAMKWVRLGRVVRAGAALCVPGAEPAERVKRTHKTKSAERRADVVALLAAGPKTFAEIMRGITHAATQTRAELRAMVGEGLVVKDGARYVVAPVDTATRTNAAADDSG